MCRVRFGRAFLHDLIRGILASDREKRRSAEVTGAASGADCVCHDRSWLDASGTSVAVQQKMMRHADVITTMNIYGDVVTDEMTAVEIKVAQLAFQSNGAQAKRSAI